MPSHVDPLREDAEGGLGGEVAIRRLSVSLSDSALLPYQKTSPEASPAGSPQGVLMPTALKKKTYQFNSSYSDLASVLGFVGTSRLKCVEVMQLCTPGPQVLWTAGLVHLRSSLWDIVVADTPAVQAGSGSAASPPVSPVKVIETELTKVCFADSGKRLPRLGKSNLENAFQHICKTAPTSAVKLREAASDASHESSVLTSSRDQLLSMVSDSKQEPRRRSKACLSLLSIGCGHGSLCDTLLSLRGLSLLQKDMFDGKGVIYKPECNKVVMTWATQYTTTPAWPPSCRGAFTTALFFSAALHRPVVPIKAGDAIPPGHLMLLIASTLQSMMTSAAVTDSAAVTCHADVVVLLGHLLLALSERLKAGASHPDSCLYLMSVFLQMLKANATAAVHYDEATIPSSSLCTPPSLPYHDAQTTLRYGEVVRLSADLLATVLADLQGYPTSLKASLTEVAGLAASARARCLAYSAHRPHVAHVVLRNLFLDLMPSRNFCGHAAVAAVLAVVQLAGGGTGVRRGSSATTTVVPRFSVEEALCLLQSISGDVDTLREVVQEAQTHCEPNPSGRVPAPPLVTLALELIDTQEVLLPRSHTLTTKRYATTTAVHDSCQNIIFRWLAALLKENQEELGGGAVTNYMSALLDLFKSVAGLLQTAQTTPAPAVFRVFSMVVGALVHLLVPASVIGRIPSFILCGSSASSDNLDTSSRLSFASETSCIVNHLFANLNTSGLPSTMGIGRMHSWRPTGSEVAGGVWLRYNERSAIRKVLRTGEADAAAIVISMVIPADTGEVVVEGDGVKQVSNNTSLDERFLMYVAKGNEATVTIEICGVSVDIARVKVRWVSLPHRVDPAAESLLLCGWMCGGAASAALVLSRVGITDAEASTSTLLASPLFLYGMEAPEHHMPSFVRVRGEKQQSSKDVKASDVFCYPHSYQTEKETRMLHGVLRMHTFLRNLCENEGPAAVLHAELQQAKVGERMDTALRCIVAALLKHSRRLTEHAADMADGYPIEPADRASVIRCWKVASKARFWLLERKQAWQLASSDHLSDIITSRASFLLQSRYHGSPKYAEDLVRRRSTLFDLSEALQTRHLPEAAECFVGVDTTQLVLEFVLPNIPLPDQPLGLDSMRLEEELPSIVRKAADAAVKEIRNLEESMKRRAERVPHCIAALQFSAKMLTCLRRAEEGAGRSPLLCGVRAAFLSTLTAGCRSRELHSPSGFHPLALLEGVAPSEVLQLQRAFYALCTSVGSDLSLIIASPEETSSATAALSWFCLDIGLADIEWIQHLNIIPYLVPKLFLSKTDSTALAASVLRHFLFCMVEMLTRWDAVVAVSQLPKDPSAVHEGMVSLVTTAAGMLSEGLRDPQACGGHGTAQALELLSILELCTPAALQTPFSEALLSDEALVSLANQRDTFSNSAQVAGRAAALICQRVLSHAPVEGNAPPLTEAQRERVQTLIHQLIRAVGRTETSLFLSTTPAVGVNEEVGDLVHALGGLCARGGELAELFAAELWRIVDGVETTFGRYVRVMQESEHDVQDTPELDEAVAALIMLAGRDTPPQAGSIVDVWVGDTTHVRCCGAEEVLCSGHTPHGVIERWVPGVVESVDSVHGRAKVCLEAEKLPDGDSVFMFEHIRHRGDGSILVNTAAHCKETSLTALSNLLQFYVKSDHVFKKKTKLGLTRCLLHVASKAVKLIHRVSGVDRVAFDTAFNRPAFLTTLCAIASRNTSLLFATFPGAGRGGFGKLQACTTSLNGSRGLLQPSFHCESCAKVDGTVTPFCAYCAKVCHRGHDVTEVFDKTGASKTFACRCVSSASKLCCASMSEHPEPRGSLLAQAVAVTRCCLGLMSASHEFLSMSSPPQVPSIPLSPPDHSFECLREMMDQGFPERTCLTLLSSNKGDIARTLRQLHEQDGDSDSAASWFFDFFDKKVPKDILRLALKTAHGTDTQEWMTSTFKAGSFDKGVWETLLDRTDWASHIDSTVPFTEDGVVQGAMQEMLALPRATEHIALGHPSPLPRGARAGDIVVVKQDELRPPVLGVLTQDAADADLLRVVVSGSAEVIPVSKAQVWVQKRRHSDHEPDSVSDLHRALYGSLIDLVTVMSRDLLLKLVITCAATSRQLRVERTASAETALNKALANCFILTAVDGNLTSADVQLLPEQYDAVDALGRIMVQNNEDTAAEDTTTTLLDLVLPSSLDALLSCAEDDVFVVDHTLQGRASGTHGCIRFWHCEVMAVLFKSTTLLNATLSFYYDEDHTTLAWSSSTLEKTCPEGSMAELPPALYLPASKIYYEIAPKVAKEKEKEKKKEKEKGKKGAATRLFAAGDGMFRLSGVCFHASPLCQFIKEGAVSAKPNVGFSLSACRAAAVANRTTILHDSTQFFSAGGIDNYTALKRCWAACMACVKLAYVPYKAQAYSILCLLLPQLASIEVAENAESDVLKDLFYIRLDAEQVHRRHERDASDAGGFDASFFRAVELLSIARKFTKADVCLNLLLPETQPASYVVEGNACCVSCAMTHVLANPGTTKPEFRFEPNKRCNGNRLPKWADRYRWVEAEDFAQVEHLFEEKEYASGPGTSLRYLMGTARDGELLVPFLKSWAPHPMEYHISCGFVDRVAMMRRELEYLSGESPAPPVWLVNEIVADAMKRAQVEQSDHPYYEVSGEGECLEAPMVFFTFDKRCQTQTNHRVVLFDTKTKEELHSVGGECISNQSIAVKGRSVSYKFCTVNTQALHGFPCGVCKKDICGLRYNCGVCSEDLCATCAATPGAHPEHHLLTRISRPTLSPPPLLPVVYPFEYWKSKDRQNKPHAVACDTCGMDPIVGTRFWCQNCPCEYNLCSVCVEQDTHPWAHVFVRVVHPLPKFSAAALNLPLPSMYCDEADAADWGWLFTAEIATPMPPREKLATLHQNVSNAFEGWTMTHDAELLRWMSGELYLDHNTFEGPALSHIPAPESEYGLIHTIPVSAIRFRFALLRSLDKKMQWFLRLVDPSSTETLCSASYESQMHEACAAIEKRRVASGQRPYSSTSTPTSNAGVVPGIGTTFSFVSLPAMLRRLKGLISKPTKLMAMHLSMQASQLSRIPRIKLKLRRMGGDEPKQTRIAQPNFSDSSDEEAPCFRTPSSLALASEGSTVARTPSGLPNLVHRSPTVDSLRQGSNLTELRRLHSGLPQTPPTARRTSTDSFPEESAKSCIILQAFKQIGATQDGLFRSKHTAWKVVFLGEASDDYGGPFRDSLTDMCEDVMTGSLSLLLPVPNAAAEIGGNRDTFLPNALASSVFHTHLMEFIGKLMGVAIRSKTVFPVNLPQFVWKSLAQEPISSEDIKEVDSLMDQCLDTIDVLSGYYATDMGGRQVPLRGSNSSLPDDVSPDPALFKKLHTLYKLNEGRHLVASLSKGFASVLPKRFMPLFGAWELQLEVSGSPDLDVCWLKDSTVYSGYDRIGPELDFLWRALRQFSSHERSLFLKFVWGRSRVGARSVTADGSAGEDAPQMEVRKMPCDRPDETLPTSHTCFFRLELPEYTTYEICHAKLKYAVTHCNVIDTDYTAHAIASRDEE